jgi:hypothetical protein
MRKSLNGKKNGEHWESIIGYTAKDLMKHLENQFKDGMSWSNYGGTIGMWSIDHIIPVSAFNFVSKYDIDFKKCWSLTNLAPMWVKDNSKKSNKLEKPFQPSLSFSA